MAGPVVEDADWNSGITYAVSQCFGRAGTVPDLILRQLRLRLWLLHREGLEGRGVIMLGRGFSVARYSVDEEFPKDVRSLVDGLRACGDRFCEIQPNAHIISKCIWCLIHFDSESPQRPSLVP